MDGFLMSDIANNLFMREKKNLEAIKLLGSLKEKV
jgi:hypothetical protein